MQFWIIVISVAKITVGIVVISTNNKKMEEKNGKKKLYERANLQSGKTSAPRR